MVWLPIVLFLADFTLRVSLAGLIILRGRSTSSSRLAWLVVILAIPGIGIVAYLLVGEVRLGSRRRKRYASIVGRVSEQAAMAAAKQSPVQTTVPEAYRQVAYLAETGGSNPARSGHDLTLFSSTGEFVDALIDDIEASHSHCHLLFYIFLTDTTGTRVAHALGAAARRGIACRLLVDGVGSRSFLESTLRRDIERAGVKVVEALPTNLLRAPFARIDLRNHRKIAVIDGLVAYSGSQNIADASFAIKPKYAPWFDVMIRIDGPAARDLQVIFVEDWFLDTDESLEEVLEVMPPVHEDGAIIQVMATGPTAYYAALRQLTQLSFHTAREELILTTPYFVPDEATATALEMTARRGVEVTLVVPARNDSPLVAAASRSFYDDLLGAGVDICEFRPGLLHAKTTTIDRRLAVISTANLDRRSFELNFELSVLVYDSDFASQLRLLQRSYMGESAAVLPSTWSRRSVARRLVQNMAGMLAPLL